MSKKTNRPAAGKVGEARNNNDAAQAEKAKNPQAARETLESVVVAIILAFLFRAFIAEAFVIPTGSMAPTLYGRNKDLVCEQCAYQYAAGASGEIPREPNNWGPNLPQLMTAYCPICRIPMDLDPGQNGNHTSFSGDRILVSKFAYALAQPKRWDVIVFKYPGNAKQNYIKRLIGLPNEAVMIFNGNIHTADFLFRVERDVFLEPIEGLRAMQGFFASNGVTLSDTAEIHPVFGSQSVGYLIEDGERAYAMTHNSATNRISVYGDRFQIQRKPPHKLLAMLQVVDDTRFVGERLKEANWPSRWQDWSGAEKWKVLGDGQFSTQGKPGETAWLRYRHLPPSEEDWQMMDQGVAPVGVEQRRGALIDDYYAYNMGVLVVPGVHSRRSAGPSHWVGDLAFECDVKITGQSGKLVLDLVEGGAHYLCHIDVATGKATLSIKDGEEGFSDAGDEAAGDEAIIPTVSGDTAVKAGGAYHLRFANVDDQLSLWVNNSLVKFTGPTTYRSRRNVTPVHSVTDAGDAEPIGVGSEGGLALEVNQLKVMRDIYYVATTTGGDEYQDIRMGHHKIQEIMRSPDQWATTPLFSRRPPALFGMEEDHFFPLGDNSPESKDARMWDNERFVDRELLIGKAVLIYWPHPWQAPIPYFPNFGRMGLIR